LGRPAHSHTVADHADYKQDKTDKHKRAKT
jgi:hypothetical protein